MPSSEAAREAQSCLISCAIEGWSGKSRVVSSIGESQLVIILHKSLKINKF